MDAQYIKQALEYRYFVVVDGLIYTGNQYREDAIDALKECREYHPTAKLMTRKSVSAEALVSFYKVAFE